MLKGLGIGLGSLIGVILLFLVAIYAITEYRINKTYNVPAETVSVPTDAASIAYGEHVATIRACRECHGPDLAGRKLIEDPMVGLLYSTNLTSGKGGVGGTYTDGDFGRAIRHGIGSDGKPLLAMPSYEFYPLSNTDLGAVIAYIHSLPAVDNERPPAKLALMIRAVYLLTGKVPLLSAERIDHAAQRPIAPEVAVSVEYGKYLATTCTGCHGEGMSGGYIPGIPPEGPAPLNLTPGGELVGWSESDFLTTLYTGVTPSGRQLDNQYMPWKLLGQMTDDELKAVWQYLQTLPPKQQGNR